MVGDGNIIRGWERDRKRKLFRKRKLVNKGSFVVVVFGYLVFNLLGEFWEFR